VLPVPLPQVLPQQELPLLVPLPASLLPAF
jgi:hypothetical protein